MIRIYILCIVQLFFTSLSSQKFVFTPVVEFSQGVEKCSEGKYRNLISDDEVYELYNEIAADGQKLIRDRGFGNFFNPESDYPFYILNYIACDQGFVTYRSYLYSKNFKKPVNELTVYGKLDNIDSLIREKISLSNFLGKSENKIQSYFLNSLLVQVQVAHYDAHGWSKPIYSQSKSQRNSEELTPENLKRKLIAFETSMDIDMFKIYVHHKGSKATDRERGKLNRLQRQVPYMFGLAVAIDRLRDYLSLNTKVDSAYFSTSIHKDITEFKTRLDLDASYSHTGDRRYLDERIFNRIYLRVLNCYQLISDCETYFGDAEKLEGEDNFVGAASYYLNILSQSDIDKLLEYTNERFGNDSPCFEVREEAYKRLHKLKEKYKTLYSSKLSECYTLYKNGNVASAKVCFRELEKTYYNISLYPSMMAKHCAVIQDSVLNARKDSISKEKIVLNEAEELIHKFESTVLRKQATTSTSINNSIVDVGLTPY